MNNDTRWLARIGIDQGLITRPQALQVSAKIGATADLVSFAQELIDSGIVTDVEKLEKIAELAAAKADAGPPQNDPLETNTSNAPFVSTRRHADPDSEDEETPATNGAPAGSPSFAFETLGQLDELKVAEAMRNLLKDTARFGASDLHLSTGARPFIRKNRALAYISDYVLKPE